MDIKIKVNLKSISHQADGVYLQFWTSDGNTPRPLPIFKVPVDIMSLGLIPGRDYVFSVEHAGVI